MERSFRPGAATLVSHVDPAPMATPGRRTLVQAKRELSGGELEAVPGGRTPASGGPARGPSGGGAPIVEPVRHRMEALFGASFATVRIHEGPEAAQLGAVAFARGEDIHFQPGRYEPTSPAGQELLGHELSHDPPPTGGGIEVGGGGGSAVQQRPAAGAPASDPDSVKTAAAHGTSGAAGTLPHLDRIQRLFGRHDVTGVRSYVGASAAEGAAAMGAQAFATGDQVAFGGAPDLHTAAHEAAHVVQQRGGVQLKSGVGEVGDPYERHADEVADRVVQGRSAEDLLDRYAGGGGTPAIQRYSIEDGYRISATRTVAVEDKSEVKQFFAKPEALAQSNGILDGMQSKVKLVAGDNAPDQLRGMTAVHPVPRDIQQPKLFDSSECIVVADRVTSSGQTHAIYQPSGEPKTLVELKAQEIALINKLIELLTVKPDVTPHDVAGAQDAMRPHDDSDSDDELGKKFEFNLRGKSVDTNSPKDASEAIEPVIGDRNLRIALLLNVMKEMMAHMPKEQQRLIDDLELTVVLDEIQQDDSKDESKIEKWTEQLKVLVKQREQEEDKQRQLQEQQDRETQAKHSIEYGKLDDNLKDERSAQLGVNQHARPDVGESYGIVSTRARTQEDKDKWSFHFAAVVARDGDDSITLENYNRGEEEGGDDKWYFDMYGPKQQSFHDRHAHTVADGVTLRMGAAATSEMREDFLRRIEAKLGEPPTEIRNRLEKAATRAELAAIYAEAVGEH